jgi:hypothetical protein
MDTQPPTPPKAESPDPLTKTAEGQRLRMPGAWRRWGPYLSERQWGTVREDYSPFGTAWDYLTHDQARSHAYRWGEDGIGGFSDNQQRWCLSLALWNEADPILKERLFGLTNAQGNHGEDVKEVYYYSDGLPTHAYMRMLYKYPQAPFPYEKLVEENRARGLGRPEFELTDTGVFDADRYFDVVIEYAKGGPDDILLRLTVHNRADRAAPLHVLPQLWARNIWSWAPNVNRPSLRATSDTTVMALHPAMPAMEWHVDYQAELLFCENETNGKRLFGLDGPGPFKDGFHDYLIGHDADAVSFAKRGTKAAAHIRLELGAGESRVLRLRLRPAFALGNQNTDCFADFEAVFATRIAETDAFYATLQRDMADADARMVQRQALAGMLWSKQFYYLDIRQWLDGDPAQPPPPASRKTGRNSDWRHLNNADVISMPDTWEYPWYAAWDLAFHCVTFAMIDPGFAKAQLVLLTRDWYMHPNGQLPAYEWAFGDVNPPVHAWAALRVYRMDRALHGVADRPFLERVFHKLMLNFNWWVNRKDEAGRNIFQGGFLGLDNIALFDRSAPLPTGGTISQSDGTAWMAMYALNLMRIALELSLENPVYEDLASKFFEHFLLIAEAMTQLGGAKGLWDEQDQFFYDVLNLPNGEDRPLRVRSMVGLIPLFAVEVLGPNLMQKFPKFAGRLQWFLNYRPDLAALVSRWTEPAMGGREGSDLRLLSLLRGHRMKQLLRRMLDETEFLSDHGVRALSKFHAAHPFVLEHNRQRYEIAYTPGESTSGLFGGNSNWRGPVWMPVNYLLITSLYEFHRYYGEDFKVECPVGSGTMLSLREVADELGRRLGRLFLRGPDGRRPIFGDDTRLQTDPHFRDHLNFNEYFHGDTGRGLGANHQTGWTGLVALLLRADPAREAMTTELTPGVTARG